MQHTTYNMQPAARRTSFCTTLALKKSLNQRVFALRPTAWPWSVCLAAWPATCLPAACHLSVFKFNSLNGKTVPNSAIAPHHICFISFSQDSLQILSSSRSSGAPLIAAHHFTYTLTHLPPPPSFLFLLQIESDIREPPSPIVEALTHPKSIKLRDDIDIADSQKT
jgi:hypothetical protein